MILSESAMSQVLLIVLGLYLAGCYAYGLYVLARLFMVRSVHRPTSRQEPKELARAARAELTEDGTLADDQRLAA